jgi:hypothetical protein
VYRISAASGSLNTDVVFVMRGQINANMAATIPQTFNIVSISKVTFDLFFKPVVSGRFGRLEAS